MGYSRMIPLDTPEAIAASKARKLAARVFPACSDRVRRGEFTWPGKAMPKAPRVPKSDPFAAEQF